MYVPFGSVIFPFVCTASPTAVDGNVCWWEVTGEYEVGEGNPTKFAFCAVHFGNGRFELSCSNDVGVTFGAWFVFYVNHFALSLVFATGG